MLALANTLAAAGFAPARLEAAMLAAVMASGGSAWYVPDDFLTLGPELVPSGSFDSSAGWTLGAGWAISGGKLTATAAATGSSSVINAGLVAGKNYLVTYDIDSISAGATTPIANGATSTQQTTSGQKVSFITPVGSTGNVGLNSSSATALTASFDNFSVREILSAKDFQDSAGTLPSYLGGTVGLGLDATAVVGAELIGDVDFNDLSNWNLATTAPATSTVSGGKLRIYAPAGESSSAIQAVSRGTATIGKLYKFTLDVEAYTGTAGVHFAGSGATTIPAGTGIKTIYAVADGAMFGVKRLNVCDITINSISVKEISGNNVTQATAGNRPTITRIPRKLGAEMALFNGTTGGWATHLSSISVVGGKLRVTNSGAFGRAGQPIQFEAGKSYQLSATAEFVSGTNDNSYLAVSAAIDGTPSASSAQTAAGPKSLVFAASGPSYIRLNSADATDVNDWSAISVREVLEWSYALTFDGSNDSLAAPTSVIGATLTQPYTMIAWCLVGAIGASRSLIGDAARVLRVYWDGSIGAAHGGVGEVKTGAGAVYPGQLVIIETTYDGVNAARVYLQGALAASNNALPGPTTAAAATCLGQRGNSTEFFNGNLVGSVVCPAVMTDAQRLAVRKFAAAQMGMTL